MNNFEKDPETVFSGDMTLFGIRSPQLSTLGLFAPGSLMKLTVDWPDAVSGEGNGWNTIFNASAIGKAMALGDKQKGVSSVDATAERVRLQLDDELSPADWLQEEIVDEACVGVDAGTGENWEMIGITSELAVAASARRVWLPPMNYGEGRRSSVVTMRPLRADVVEYVEELLL